MRKKYLELFSLSFMRFVPIFLILFGFINSDLICQSKAKLYSSEITAEQIIKNFIKLHPDSITYQSEEKSHKWNYEQGLILEAFYQMWKTTGEKDYFDYIKKNLNHYIDSSGNIKTYKYNDFNIDNIAPGRSLLNLYTATRDDKYLNAAKRLRKQLENQPRTSEKGFWHKKIYPSQMWLDGLYMGEPFYAKYALLFDDNEAFDDIFNQFNLIDLHLKDSSSGLYFHGWDESKKQKWADPLTGTSPNFWGRGLGWYCMALVDVLDYFPVDHPKRVGLITILKNLSLSLIKYRDVKTKLWFQVLDQGNRDGNYFEASGSLMFIYAFAKGANKGYLDKKYYDFAKESFQGVLGNLVTVDENGIIYLKNICAGAGLGGKPYRDGSYEYYVNEKIRVNDFKGYGPFILSAIELENPPFTDSTLNNGEKEFSVGLDYYFNNENKNGERFHYTWEDTANSGFSELGNLIKKLGGTLNAIKTAPTMNALKEVSIYILVDPDIPSENLTPNYLDEVSRKEIVSWVHNGGTLLVFANDSLNCEFVNLNLLTEKFGIHFNGDSKNRVVGKNFSLGKIDSFPLHPIFEKVNSIYLKEISTLKLSASAKCILENNENCLIAFSDYGNGSVLAVGDPWFYNEYYDNRKLPKEFENYKAAENLFLWLKDKINHK